MGDQRVQIEKLGESWGVQFDDEALDAAATASASVQEWVRGANDDPERALRIGQVLAVGDPGSKAHGRLLNQVSHGVGDAITRLGGKQHRLFRLRVLIDLHLGELKGGRPNALLATSAGDLQTTVGARRWREIVGSLDGAIDDGFENDAGSAAQLDELAQSPDLAELTDKATELNNWLSNPQSPPHIQAGVRKLVEQLEAQRQALGAIETNQNSLITVVEALGDLPRQVNAWLADLQGLQRLLWWGQSRYSSLMSRPYRRLESDQLRTVVGAVEAAELARHLPIEPSASFLVESLSSVGVDVAERRPLGFWVEETVDTVRRTKALASACLRSSILREVLETAPCGLAGAWCLLGNVDAKDDAHLADILGVDLSIEVDRGQWATWLFRERMLDVRLHKAQP